MTLSEDQKNAIRALLESQLKNKLKKYRRETQSMPFLEAIFQNPSQLAVYSFTHSVATSLGQSVFANVAKIIAKPNFDEVKTEFDLEGEVAEETRQLINNIMNEYKSDGRKANKKQEIEEILKSIQKSASISKKKISKKKKMGVKKIKRRVDLYLKKGENEYCIEIKSPKPNINEFNKEKEKLLYWVALCKKNATTKVAMPYNPYSDDEYTRFAMQSVLDTKEELLTGDDFWAFLNNGEMTTYTEVITIFNEVGQKYNDEIKLKINSLNAPN